MKTTLAIEATLSKSPFVYATGTAVGSSATRPLVAGFGSDLNIPPVNGMVVAFTGAGSVSWTYQSPNQDYAMGGTTADIDGDGNNEIIWGFRKLDHCATALKNDGTFLWSWNNPIIDYSGLGDATSYVRWVAAGKVTNAVSGLQVVAGGQNGTLVILDKSGNVLQGPLSLCGGMSCIGTSADTVQSIALDDQNGDGLAEIFIGYNFYIRKYDNTLSQVWQSDQLGGGTNNDCFVYGVAAGKFSNSVPGRQSIGAVGCLNGVELGNISRFAMVDQNGKLIWKRDMHCPVWSVAYGDVNGDGLLEVICGYGTHNIETPNPPYDGGVTVLDGNGTPIAAIELPSSVKTCGFGDADNDGANEIVAACDDGNVYIISITNT